MKILFYLGYSSLSGYGSEISLENLAIEMARDHSVYILSINPIAIDQYIDKPYKIINKDQYLSMTFDFVIISRYINFFIYLPNRSKYTILWLHDNALQPYFKGVSLPNYGGYLFNNVKIDKIIVQTQYHKNIFSQYFPESKHLIEIIGNGNNISFPTVLPKRHDMRFIYTSNPDRGLLYLLSIFPIIKNRYPDAELFIYRDENEMNTYSDSIVKSGSKPLFDIINSTAGVHYMNKLPHSEMIYAFLQSDFWLYPTVFNETFCMSAIEAISCGCLAIVSNRGSLPEVVDDNGIILKEKYDTPEYTNEIMIAIETMIQNKDYYRNKKYDYAKSYNQVYLFQWKPIMNNIINKTNVQTKKIRLLTNWTDNLNDKWNYLIKKDFPYDLISDTNISDNIPTIVFNSTNSFDLCELRQYNGYHISMESTINQKHINESWRGKGDIDRNIIEWHLGCFHGKKPNLEFEYIENYHPNKTTDFVSIMSGLSYLPLHTKRLKFLKDLEIAIKTTNIRHDIYGKNKLDFMENYKGYSEGKIELFDTKYTIAIENTCEIGYFTEKIVDGILAECLVFYYGCPNIDDYIDSRAYICIDLDNIEKSIDTIISSIKNNEWEKRISFIRNEKKTYYEWL